MRAVVQFKRQTTSMERVIRRVWLLGMGRAFSRWKQFTRQRLLVCRIVLRWQQRLLAASFERWQHWVEKRLRASEVGEDRAAFIARCAASTSAAVAQLKVKGVIRHFQACFLLGLIFLIILRLMARMVQHRLCQHWCSSGWPMHYAS